jgi:hypothetical protein
MDPNVALAELKAQIVDVIAQMEKLDLNKIPTEALSAFEAANDVILKFQDLDEWLSKGGFVPDAWKSTT